MNLKLISFNLLIVNFIFIIIVHHVLSSSSPLSSTLSSNNETYLWKRLINLSNKTIAKVFLPNYIELNDKLFYNKNLTEKCRKKLLSIHDAMFSDRKTYAFQLFNSWPSSILPTGLLIGNMVDYGDYDQCMDIDPNELIVKHCIVDMKIPMPKPIPLTHNLFHETENILPKHYYNDDDDKIKKNLYYYLVQMSSYFYYASIRKGICLPIECINNDIEIITENGFGKEIFDLEIKNIICSSKTIQPWYPNNIQIFSLIFISFFILMAIVSGFYDWFVMKKKNNKLEKFLLWFSPIMNIKKILSSKSTSRELSCIHGIRVFSMGWIILGHVVPFFDMNRFSQLFWVKDEITNPYLQPFFKGFYAVETFFFLSGLMISYSTILLTGGNYKKFRIIQFLLTRFLRLTPQLLAFMIILTLLPSLSNGPIWKYRMDWMINLCENSWWKNLIFMQNLIDSDVMCEPHLWYLAADMQLHWLSVLPLIFLLRNPKLGLLISKLLIIITIILQIIWIVMENSPPGTIISAPIDFRFGDKPGKYLKFYDKPWNHAHVFFIGFIFGYYLHYHIKPNKFNWTISKTIMAWLTILMAYLLCIYDTYPWIFGLEYNPIWSSILSPLNGLLWSMILIIIIIICVTDEKSFISRILSWNFFRPLSRMTFSVFLTHFLVVYVIRDSSRDLLNLHTSSMIMMGTSILNLAYINGFLFTLLFESPIVNIFTMLRERFLLLSPTTATTTINDNNNNNIDQTEMKINNDNHINNNNNV